ncbi:MAG: phage tail protein I [Rubrivivax sp.]|nr:MAG: phage tail protein I [Rubrivivax sp.]
MVDAVDAIPVPHRSLWNADTCPVALLPWLAWTMGVEGWRPEWPEQVKRARIRSSISIHRRKGTVKAVKDAVNSFGAQISIREWWETSPQGEPHTFELVLTVPEAGAVTTADFIDDVIAEVNRTKPLRSHFSFVLGLSGKARLAVAAVGRPVIYARLDMEVA